MVTSSPGAGEVFPLRGSFMRYKGKYLLLLKRTDLTSTGQKLPLSGELAMPQGIA